MTDLLAAALSYAARGWPVFPVFWVDNGRCGCGNIDCKSPGKHPLIAGGLLNAMTDVEVVKAWWQKYPLANIGIPTGKTSGIIVVDVDDKAGLPALKKLVGKFRDIPRQRTGRDSSGHFLFKYPGSHVKSGTKFLPGLDSRGDGGYIVAAPSMHVSGKQYKLLYLPKNDEFPEPSRALLDAINGVVSNGDNNSNGFKPPFDTKAALKGAPTGKRRDNVFRLASKLRQADVPIEAAQELAIKATQNSEQLPGDPFTETEALAQVEDVYKRYPAGESLVVLEASEAPEDEQTDTLKDGDSNFPEVAWTGLFLKWRDIVAPCTEAALESLWGAFLIAVGLVIGRNAWRWSPRPLYPNFYLLLIGQTGDSRKSTVLWLACELLRHVGVDFKELDGVVSSEGIYQALADREGTRGLVYADEFRALLNVAKRKGTQDILPRLNSLYYCPERASIDRVKDSTVIVQPFLSLVTATPQAYVDDILSDLEISGGFLNRFLIISGPEQDPKPIVRSPSIEAWGSIANELRRVGERTCGHFEMTAEAGELWSSFYTSWKKERRTWHPKQANLTARTFEHVLKIAMIYSALAGKREIDSESLTAAVVVGRWLQSNTMRLFADTGMDRFGKCEQVIIDILKQAKKGRMWRRNLQRELSGRGFNGEIFVRAVKSLESNDHVRGYSVVVGSGRKRPVVEYLYRH